MQKCNENAANRYSFVGEVYNLGEKNRKEQVLDQMPECWSRLHRDGYIHIHDLDAYGLSYNCLTFDILNDFPYHKFSSMSQTRKVVATFDYLRSLFADIGNEQSGGMALANFDNDVSTILQNLGVELNDITRETIRNAVYGLIRWCNDTHTRMGQTSYYVSLNIGLAQNEFARFIAFTLLDEFEQAGDMVYKPNIIFKVKSGVNSSCDSPNFHLFRKALLCTAKKMIPTYLLCDSAPNKEVDANNLAIMGCRTRVVANLFGENSSIGRGNIANISINLPRLALETLQQNSSSSISQLIDVFTEKWDNVARKTKDILLDRFSKVCERKVEDFPINSKHKLWLRKFDNPSEVFKNGTLSLGFIGLSEAMEILTGKRFYLDADVYVYALSFVKHMRQYCDFLRDQYNLNFSLLATSGELISGRFVEIDKTLFDDKHDIFRKGFYTNSFHVNVDSELSAFRKIQLEAIFHEMCNGGCISYVELKEAPIGNDEGLRELIEIAVQSGTHYLGFNFPKDICNKCGATGVFDSCTCCGSNEVTRIRRVSGYLEVLDGFTQGKKNEVKLRKEN